MSMTLTVRRMRRTEAEQRTKWWKVKKEALFVEKVRGQKTERSSAGEGGRMRTS